MFILTYDCMALVRQALIINCDFSFVVFTINFLNAKTKLFRWYWYWSMNRLYKSGRTFKWLKCKTVIDNFLSKSVGVFLIPALINSYYITRNNLHDFHNFTMHFRWIIFQVKNSWHIILKRVCLQLVESRKYFSQFIETLLSSRKW